MYLIRYNLIFDRQSTSIVSLLVITKKKSKIYWEQYNFNIIYKYYKFIRV